MSVSREVDSRVRVVLLMIVSREVDSRVRVVYESTQCVYVLPGEYFFRHDVVAAVSAGPPDWNSCLSLLLLRDCVSAASPNWNSSSELLLRYARRVRMHCAAAECGTLALVGVGVLGRVYIMRTCVSVFFFTERPVTGGPY